MKLLEGDTVLVGYMDNNNAPASLVNIIAVIAKAKGINIIYFNPEGINLETNKIIGSILIGDNWVKSETDIPRIIDVEDFDSKQHDSIISHLAEHSYLISNDSQVLSSDEFLVKLKKEEEIKKYITPSNVCDSFNVLEEYLNSYDETLIAPSENRYDIDSYKITKNQPKKTFFGYKTIYTLSSKSFHKEVTLKELELFYNNTIKANKYIVQQYISSKTINGDPFDCRIHLEKNSSGEWQIAKNFIRIGLGPDAMFNVKDGSGIAESRVFFRANYPESSKKILRSLKTLALNFANNIEKLSQFTLTSIDLDIDIDVNKNLYISRINSSTSPDMLHSQIALLRTDYYNYLALNTLSNDSKKKQTNHVQ